MQRLMGVVSRFCNWSGMLMLVKLGRLSLLPSTTGHWQKKTLIQTNRLMGTTREPPRPPREKKSFLFEPGGVYWAGAELNCCCCCPTGRGPWLPLHHQVACTELELDCCCHYPTGRGPRLPWRRQVACAELELDCCCYYPTGRGPRLSYRRQVACAELELDCCCYYPTGRGLRLGAASGAGAGLLLLLHWTSSTASLKVCLGGVLVRSAFVLHLLCAIVPSAMIARVIGKWEFKKV